MVVFHTKTSNPPRFSARNVNYHGMTTGRHAEPSVRPLRKQDRGNSRNPRQFDTDMTPDETVIVNNRDIAQEEWLMLQLAELPVVVRHLFLGMRQAGFTDSLTRELLSRFTEISDMGEPLTLTSGWALLRNILSKKLRVVPTTPLNTKPFRVMLLGPAGGGKSTVVQKVAGRVPTRERSGFTAISVVLDDQDVRRQPERLALVRGAEQELHLFGQPLSPVLRQVQLQSRVMVDVTGTCADTERQRRLLQRTLIGAEDFIKLLVMPVNLHPFDMQEQLRRYEEIGYDHLVLTKVDQTCCPANIANVAYLSGRPISMVSDGADAARHLHPANLNALLDLVFQNLPIG